MSDKTLKKKYNAVASKNMIVIRLNTKEAVMLEKMMSKIGATNISGYIKYKLFQGQEESCYNTMLNKGEKEDSQIIIKNLVKQMVSEFSYLNYRYNKELDKITGSATSYDEQTAKKVIATMTQWKKTVMKKTESICSDLKTLLRHLDINDELPAEQIDWTDVRNLPDEALEKASANPYDTNSPEVLEAARRQFEEFERKLKEKIERREKL